MSHIIKNFDQLAVTKEREDALAIVEAGYDAIDTDKALRRFIKLNGDILRIQNQEFDLSKFENVFVIGFGKVSCKAASVLEEILNGCVKEGAVIGIEKSVCKNIVTYAGSHPLPSQINFEATTHIERISQNANEKDLVIAIVSGGGSALPCGSQNELDQGQKLFKSFLSSGGDIKELNTVRKHISNIKGGGLAKQLYPATVISLIFSDVPGNDLASIASGPTLKDNTTISDAKAIIQKYNLGDFELFETPKEDKYFEKIHNILLISNETATSAMNEKAKELGYEVEVLGHDFYDFPKEMISRLSAKTKPGTVVLVGGETRMIIPDGCKGKGGRNDFLTLEFMDFILENQIFISFASDGKDNTEAAGAIADKISKKRAEELKLNNEELKKCLDSFPFFEKTESLIITGPIEANVSDIMLLLNAKSGSQSTKTASNNSSAITDVTARQILNSRGKPTIEVAVFAGEVSGICSAPSGASTGASEVREIDISQAIKNIEEKVKPALLGKDVTKQKEIDETLHDIDKTILLEEIGGNTAIATSIACAKAGANLKGQELFEYIRDLAGIKKTNFSPLLFINLINGGKHAKGGSPIQEHQIVPQTNDIEKAYEIAKRIEAHLKDIVLGDYKPEEVTIGDEGGLVFAVKSIEQPFEYLEAAIKEVNADIPVAIGCDIAATSLFSDDKYDLLGKKYSKENLKDLYKDLIKKFPNIFSIEDPFMEEDFESFAKLLEEEPELIVIGDDLTTTNFKRLEKAIDSKSMNSIIIKPNQIGTLSDTISTVKLAIKNGINPIVSHRSGETMETFMADLAVACGCFGFKAGGPRAKERDVKYKRLIEITKHDRQKN